MGDIYEAAKLIEEDCSKPFDMLSRAGRSKVRYYIAVLVGALFALAYHIARRVYGFDPQTPIQTLRILADRNLLLSEELEDFVKLVRLRNLIIHRYWIVDDRLIYDNVKKDFRSVANFVERLNVFSRYKYFRGGKKEKLEKLGGLLRREDNVLLAIVFGSFLELDSYGDIDVAIYSRNNSLCWNYLAKVGAKLELRIPVDVVPLNELDSMFRWKILTKGIIVVEKQPGLYEALLSMTYHELLLNKIYT